MKKMIIASLMSITINADINVNFKVVNEQFKPLQYVLVSIRNYNLHCLTNENGYCTIHEMNKTKTTETEIVKFSKNNYIDKYKSLDMNDKFTKNIIMFKK